MVKKHCVISKKQEKLCCDLKMVGYFENDPSHGIKRKGINENILLYCVAGKGTVTQNGSKQNISNGDLVIIRGNTPHSYYANKNDPWNIYWAHFTGELSTFLKNYEDVCANNILHIGYQPSVIGHFEEMIHDLSSGINKFSEACSAARFVLILSELLSFRSDHHSDYKDIIEFMKENIMNISSEQLASRTNIKENIMNISLEQLASHANLSKYHFSRQFKHTTGYSPMDYYKRLKINAACNMLCNTEDSILQISEKLHYCSPYHFSEQFKAVTGYSPLKYRKVIKSI